MASTMQANQTNPRKPQIRCCKNALQRFSAPFQLWGKQKRMCNLKETESGHSHTLGGLRKGSKHLGSSLWKVACYFIICSRELEVISRIAQRVYLSQQEYVCSVLQASSTSHKSAQLRNYSRGDTRNGCWDIRSLQSDCGQQYIGASLLRQHHSCKRGKFLMNMVPQQLTKTAVEHEFQLWCCAGKRDSSWQ